MLGTLRVRNRIVDLISTYDFPVVGYTDNVAAETGETKRPKSVECQKVQTIYERDQHTGTKVRRRQSVATFEALVRFDSVEVDFEKFEDSITSQVISLPRDDAEGYESVLIELVQGVYQQPVRESKPQGSMARLTFRAFGI